MKQKKPAYDYPAFLQKLSRMEKRGALYRMLAEEDGPIPYSIKKPDGWQTDWETLHQWAAYWEDIPSVRGEPLYTLERANKRCGHLGLYTIPARAVVPGAAAALSLLGKEKEISAFRQACDQVREARPELLPWLLQYYVRIRAEHFLPACLGIARYFREGREEGRFRRELSIEGVDTKFLEQHRFLVRTLWNALFPDDQAANEEELAKKWVMEEEIAPNVCLRLLDPAQSLCGVRRLFLAAEDLAGFQPDVDRVFIMENKVNGYTFPEAPRSLALFGTGYGILDVARKAPWLAGKDLWYWGDLDSDGFLILSQLRERLPKVRSFLMTRDVLTACQSHVVADTGRREAIPQYLTVSEKMLWKQLRDQGLRLEQERIPREMVEKAVDDILWDGEL